MNKKKFMTTVALMLVTCTALVATGCGNKSLGMGNYNFKKVHIFNDRDGGVCCKVEKWYDCEMGVEVKTDKGALFLSEGTYMLVEDVCPICQK